MTSATTPEGEVFADCIGTTSGTPYYYPYYAFNGILGTDNCWIGNVGSFPHYVGYRFTQSVKILYILVRGRYNDSYVKGAEDFKLQGSDDGNTWTDIGSYTRANNNDAQYFIVTEPSLYIRYRIYITTAYDNQAAVGELQFYGRGDI